MFCAIFILTLSIGIGHGFHYHNFSQETFKDDKYDLTTNKEIKVTTKTDIPNHLQHENCVCLNIEGYKNNKFKIKHIKLSLLSVKWVYLNCY